MFDIVAQRCWDLRLEETCPHSMLGHVSISLRQILLSRAHRLGPRTYDGKGMFVNGNGWGGGKTCTLRDGVEDESKPHGTLQRQRCRMGSAL
jgi:hypothetical protein